MDRALVWFRRDLRLHDHAALYHALKAARQVWCVFIFDKNILNKLAPDDRRVQFLHDTIQQLNAAIQSHPSSPGSGLIVQYGQPEDVIPALAQTLQVQAVFANHDDDPYALQRDATIHNLLQQDHRTLHTSKDHVIFEREEVLTQTGGSFTVFTPYKKAWLKKINTFYLSSYQVEHALDRLAPLPVSLQNATLPSLAQMSFTENMPLKVPSGLSGAEQLWQEFQTRLTYYDETRNFPAVKGPSYLSTHLRFGTISIRELARVAWQQAEQGVSGAATWLSELIWRDFYNQILYHYPHVVGHSFKREYDQIQWRQGADADADFVAWCEGRTGYPLVDAGMRQLNQSGYMHNRLRMVTASFLVKDLGIDWQRGEAYFAEQLLDYDLAANNGGWQWCSSSGCDAQPHFRIFNPILQSRKFDLDGRFIRRYVPELASLPSAALHAPWELSNAELAAYSIVLGKDYPNPIVDHPAARLQTLARYRVVSQKGA
jgi:deoxyribodipyrimidine photo-lyase